MIQIPYADMIKKMTEGSSLPVSEIEKKIQQKMDQLSGLISKDGAAHIVANELGVKLTESLTGKIKIDQILAGMRSVETVGKVVNVFDVREFHTETREGKVGSMILGDDSGTIRIVCWGSQTEKLCQVQQGDIVRIKDGFVKENRGGKEIHLNDRSLFQVNPPGEKIDGVKNSVPKAARKNISELSEQDSIVEVMGHVVQAFEPKFYEICPDCGGRARTQDGSNVCAKHGPVKPVYAYLISVFLDDGTSNIRSTFFRDQVDALLGMKPDEILKFREAPEGFEVVKKNLLGSQVVVKGKVKNNEMFNRLEFNAFEVNPNPDPEEELARLNEG